MSLKSSLHSVLLLSYRVDFLSFSIILTQERPVCCHNCLFLHKFTALSHNYVTGVKKPDTVTLKTKNAENANILDIVGVLTGRPNLLMLYEKLLSITMVLNAALLRSAT